jgi:hypothetical protein
MKKVICRNVVFCEAQTEKAQLVKFESSKKVAWIPKSALRVVDSKVNNMTERKIFQVEIEEWAFNKIKYI